MGIDLKSSVEFYSAAFEIIKIQPERRKRFLKTCYSAARSSRRIIQSGDRLITT
jgi:hypothetical protein